VIRTVVAALVAVVVGAAAAEVGDAFGDGSLAPPTAPRYADAALYDLVDVRALQGDLLRLQVELGAVDPSGGLALGLTQPIIEVYLDTGPGGASSLLPGSGMRMPDGDGWNVAVRISGDGAWGWTADELGAVDLSRPVLLDAVVRERTVTVLTPFPYQPDARLYAISGVYDAFRADGWRGVERTPSPWAFSSPEPALPVIDVFPADPAAQARALASGELPARTSAARDAIRTLWIALMLAGLGVAVLGLWWRRRAPAQVVAVAPAPPHAPSTQVEAAPAEPEPQAGPVPDDTSEALIEEHEVERVVERLGAVLSGATDAADPSGGSDSRDETAAEPTDREPSGV
jgi:hypothetical protein